MVEVQHARSVLQGKGKREEGQGSDQVALSRRRKGGGHIVSACTCWPRDRGAVLN